MIHQIQRSDTAKFRKETLSRNKKPATVQLKKFFCRGSFVLRLAAGERARVRQALPATGELWFFNPKSKYSFTFFFKLVPSASAEQSYQVTLQWFFSFFLALAVGKGLAKTTYFLDRKIKARRWRSQAFTSCSTAVGNGGIGEKFRRIRFKTTKTCSQVWCR